VPAVIKRSIVYAVEGGSIVVRDLNAIGTAAQGVGTSAQAGAANANRALRSIGDEAKGMSGASSSAVLNVSNQLQDFIVQVQGGTDAFRAFGQQAPQALGAVAMAMGGLSPMFGLVTAGLATVAALSPALVTLATGHEDAAKAAEDQQKRTDELLKTLDVSSKSADEFAASIANLTVHQRELAAADLAATVRAQQKAMEDAAKAADSLIGTRGQGAAANVAVAGAFAAGEVGIVPQETVQAVQSIQKATEDLKRAFADFDAGKIRLDELKNAIVELQQPTEMSAEEFRKFQQSLLDAASAKEIARHNAELYTAQLHLMLEELGQHGVFTRHDRDVMDAAQSYDAAKAAAKSYKDELASLKEQQRLAGLSKDEQFVANAVQRHGGDSLTETQKATLALQAGDTLAAQHRAEDVEKEAAVEKRLAEVRRELADSTDKVKLAGDRLAESVRAGGGTERQIAAARALGQQQERQALAAQAATKGQEAARRAQNEAVRAAEQDAKVLDQLRVAVEGNADPIAAAMDAAQARLSASASPETIARVRELAAAVAEDAEFRKADAEAAAAMTEEQNAATAALAKANPVQDETNRLLAQYQNWLQDGVVTQEEYNRLVAERTAKEAALERQREQARRRQAIADALAGGSIGGGVVAGLLQIQAQAEDSGQAGATALMGPEDAVTGSMVDMLNGGEDAFSGLKAAALDFVRTIEQVIIKMLIVQAVEAAIGFGFGGGGAGAAGQAPTTTTIGGVYHGGGVAGEGGGGSRSLPSWLFAAAPRAHGGLMLGPDEVPIVAKRGERVLNPEETRAYGGRGAAAAVIHHAPTYNISGVTDVRVLQAVVEASSAKAQSDLERRWRSDPMSRRATVGH
jgi:hypothetical protein